MTNIETLQLGFMEIWTSLKTKPARVQEYIKTSSGKQYDPKSALARSWCADFVYWLLSKGGMPVPAPADDAARYRAIKSQSQYKVHDTSWTPRPGDIYYAPTVNGKITHHVGFIFNVVGGGSYVTLDGNTGGVTPETNWSVRDQDGKTIAGGIGGGMVCLNLRSPANIGILEFVEVPY